MRRETQSETKDKKRKEKIKKSDHFVTSFCSFDGDSQ